MDSRLVRPGELFAALPGERTDGHRFLGGAAAAGAAAIVVSRAPGADEIAALGDVTLLKVPDALIALGVIAAGWR
ncbi:MAG TPA: Mur ligase domain-containing protein, partial [Candidatus Limnocylindrales bacterium]|nr:Mur ligase domain-containing protein [Candidatus Limnocylindrales bacterium]